MEAVARLHMAYSDQPHLCPLRFWDFRPGIVVDSSLKFDLHRHLRTGGTGTPNVPSFTEELKPETFW